MMSERPDYQEEPLSAEKYSQVEQRINTMTADTFNQLRSVFEDTESFEASTGEQVQYIDIQPDTVNTNDSTPIVCIPGWAQTATTLMVPMDGLRQLGSRVVSIQDPYYGIQTTPDKELDIGKHQQRKADMYVEFLEQQDIKPVDVVCVSEGAVVAATIAKKRPDLIRNIVMVNPAGMMEKDGVLRMARGHMAQGKVIKNKEHNQGWEHDVSYLMKKEGGKQSNNYLQSSPLSALRSAYDLTRTKIDTLIGDITDDETNVSILTADEDLLFPLHEQHESIAQRTGLPPERIKNIEGSHLAHIDNPGKWTVEARKALEEMRKAA